MSLSISSLFLLVTGVDSFSGRDSVMNVKGDFSIILVLIITKVFKVCIFIFRVLIKLLSHNFFFAAAVLPPFAISIFLVVMVLESVLMHELVELLVVELTIVALAVLDIDFNVLMVNFVIVVICWQHARENINLLIVIIFHIATTAR